MKNISIKKIGNPSDSADGRYGPLLAGVYPEGNGESSF